VQLFHLDSGTAQTRDHLRIARIRTLVGAEIADFQGEGGRMFKVRNTKERV
jgi:hypothetical protein